MSAHPKGWRVRATYERAFDCGKLLPSWVSIEEMLGEPWWRVIGPHTRSTVESLREALAVAEEIRETHGGTWRDS